LKKPRVITAMSSTPLPTCREHGHDRYHHAVDAELEYTGGSWVRLFTGVSAQPKKGTFRCRECGEAFETTTDPAILCQYRRYPYIDRTATPS
jgi:hypothetical protein